jgi:transcriptional regulator with XRE-family HTH domain
MARRKSRDPEEDPSAALGEQLARLRAEAGFTTQQALAARFGLTTDVVAKAESGAQPPSPPVWAMWMDLCRVSESERQTLEALLKIARKSKGPIPEFIEKWFANEAKAAFLRLWALLFLPGQLQTREYARAMFLTEGISEDEAGEKTQVRIDRQAILAGPNAAHATAVIHERALYFQVGTPEVMIAQLQHLLKLMDKSNVVIQVIRDGGYFPGARGPFAIASGDAIPDTLLMLTVEDQMVEDGTLIRQAIALFEEIRGYALSVADSRAVILEAIEQWKRRQQQ